MLQRRHSVFQRFYAARAEQPFLSSAAVALAVCCPRITDAPHPS